MPGRINVIGEIYNEQTFELGNLKSNETVQYALSHYSYFGSHELNGARIFARDGWQTKFYGVTGDKDLGISARQFMQSKGIECECAFVSEATGVISREFDKNKNVKTIIWKGANKFVSSPIVTQKILESLNGCRGVYTSANYDLRLLYSLATECVRLKVPIMVVASSSINSKDLPWLSGVTFLSTNREGLAKLLGKTPQTNESAIVQSRSLLPYGISNVLVTLDKDGAILVSNNQSLSIQGISVGTVDTYGAGDIFRSVFYSEYLKTYDIAKSLSRANIIAANSVQISGLNKTLSDVQIS